MNQIGISIWLEMSGVLNLVMKKNICGFCWDGKARVKYTIDVSLLGGEEVVNRLHWCRETLGVNESRK